MKYYHLFAFAVLGMFLAGCSSSQLANTSASGLLSPALGLVGGLGGLYATEGEDTGTQMAATGAAAAGAYLLGQFIEQDISDEKKKEYRSGYDLGRSNSTKELYWLYQRLHQVQDGEDIRTRLFELPRQYPADGVNYVSDTVTISVTE